MPSNLKESARGLLTPLVRAALALGLTPNTVTVIGFVMVMIAAVLIGFGALWGGMILLLAGSLLDAIDGSLARASGGTTRFGAFLDSTLDRAAEAVLYIGIIMYLLAAATDPTMPVLLASIALCGSFLVSYARARGEALGATAAAGLAPRTERLVGIIIGLALAAGGWLIGLLLVLGLLALLTVITVGQRIYQVWRSLGAAR